MHVVFLELHRISVLESTAASALHVALAFFVQPEKAKMVENNNCVKKRRKGGGGTGEREREREGAGRGREIEGEDSMWPDEVVYITRTDVGFEVKLHHDITTHIILRVRSCASLGEGL